jgi:glucosamine--fructose-6-phosphate aminotransferase (isomerizing)
MCGIIGIVGKEEVADRLVDGLRRMEYRGYDSAGVCTVDDGQLIRRRAPGKLIHLVDELAAILRASHRHCPYPLGHAWRADRRQCPSPCDRSSGAGPQRHHREFPQPSRGIDRAGAGVRIETDTEVVAHLISAKVEGGLSPVDAVKASCRNCAAPSRWPSPSASSPTC